MFAIKQLDQNIDVLTLKCNAIRVEQRIVFELNFPNGMIISVQTKPSELCKDVFRFLLKKYGYESENVEIIYVSFKYFLSIKNLFFINKS